MRTRYISGILSILILISLLLVLYSPTTTTNPPSSPSPDASGLQFVGHVLPNGDVAILYYNAPTGVVIIHRDTIVPVNQICLEIYSPKGGNLTISGEQFSQYISVNQTIVISHNQTYTSKVTVPYNPDYFNSTMTTQTRAFQEMIISIPTTSSTQYVLLNIDNTSIQMQHHTSPDLIPVIFSSLGNLGIALGYTLMGVVMFFLGSITASLLLKRMKYWPEFGKMGWFLILFFLLIAMAILIFSAYYQLAYLAWYDWMIPFYLFSSLAMLELWPQTWEKLFLVIIGSSNEEGDQDWDVSFPRITRNHEDGSWEYLRPGRLAALRRLFSHVPISFSGRSAKPEGIVLKPNEEHLSNLYFLKDFPDLKRMPVRERKHFRARQGKPSEYYIPLATHSDKEIGEFIGELKAVSKFAEENESLRRENRDFRIKLENGNIRYNNNELNEITRKIFGAPMEYHKGSEPKETKQDIEKENKKEDNNGKKKE